jgi:hypothetical protein
MTKTHKICRWCSEEIQSSAIICKHCNRNQKKIWFTLDTWGSLISVIALLLSILTFFETRNERVAASKALQDTRNVANNVIKMSYVVADGSGRFGGIPQEHLNKIKEYENKLKPMLDSNLDNEINADIKEINNQIDTRIEENK